MKAKVIVLGIVIILSFDFIIVFFCLGDLCVVYKVIIYITYLITVLYLFRNRLRNFIKN